MSFTSYHDIKVDKKLYKKLLKNEEKYIYMKLCFKNNICPKCGCENSIYIDEKSYLVCEICKSRYLLCGG